MRIYTLTLVLLIFSIAWSDTLIIPRVSIAVNDFGQHALPTIAATKIITANDIKESGARNLEELLKGIVGLQVTDLTGDGSQMSISMRGFGANAAENSLILLNGMPLINPGLENVNFNEIPVDVIQEIQIINGSEGVLYGEQAVGGVINIITKKPTADGIHADASYGSYNTTIYQEGFNLLAPKNISAAMQVKKYDTDNYRDHNQDQSEQVVGNIGQECDQSGWNFNYYVSHQLLDLAGALTAKQVAENRRQAQNQIDFSDNTYQTYQFEQHHWISSTWKETLALMHRQLDSSGVLFSPYKEYQQTNWGQLTLTGLIHTIVLNSGVSFTTEKYNLNSKIESATDNQDQFDSFSQATIPIINKLNFIIGARGSWQHSDLIKNFESTSNHSAFVSTLGVEYEFIPWTTLFIRRADNFRFPKADENSLTSPHRQGLKTQTGTSYELGIHAERNRWYGTGSVFLLNLKDEIAFDPTPLPERPFGVNRNLDPTQRMGGMLDLNYHLTDEWLVGGQATHVLATYTAGPFKGNQIPLVTENTASLYSNYYFLEHWNFYTRLMITGDRYAGNDDANIFKKMPAITPLVDIALRYQGQYLFIVFKINNVFNVLYNSYESINTVSIHPFVRQAYFYPAPGRNFLVTIGFNLS